MDLKKVILIVLLVVLVILCLNYPKEQGTGENPWGILPVGQTEPNLTMPEEPANLPELPYQRYYTDSQCLAHP